MIRNSHLILLVIVFGLIGSVPSEHAKLSGVRLADSGLNQVFSWLVWRTVWRDCEILCICRKYPKTWPKKIWRI